MDFFDYRSLSTSNFIVSYDFTSSIGQVVYDNSLNSLHAVVGTTLLEDLDDPVLTDRGAYFNGNSYITLPPNALLPEDKLTLTNFYALFFVYVISPGTIFSIYNSGTRIMELSHISGSLSLFYKYLITSTTIQSSITSGNFNLGTWSAALAILNILTLSSCVTENLALKVNSKVTSLTVTSLSSTNTYDIALGSATSSFTGFISEFHLTESIYCSTAYQLHSNAVFPSGDADPYYSNQGDLCDCGDYSCTGVNAVCIKCDSSCSLACTGYTDTDCLDIVEICKPYAIISGICEISVTYMNNCKTQQSSTICNACDSGYTLSLDKTICCPKGSYGTSASTSCFSCDSTCSECFGSQYNECYSCSDSLAVLDGTSCTCPLGSNLITGACLGCLSECATCTTSTTCATCKDSKATIDLNGLCACQGSTYEGNDGLCADCHTDCLTCYGGLASNCLTCVDTNAEVVSGECVCKTSYFYNNITLLCADCHSDCLTCYGALANNCLTCVDTNAKVVSGECVCKTGYFYSSTTLLCEACGGDCSSCSDTNFCTACKDTNAQVNLITGLCSCKTGYYASSSNNLVCSICASNCLTCDAQDRCLSCSETNADLNTVTGICSCKSGFYASSTNPLTCNVCENDCLTCVDSNLCTECKDSNAQLSASPGLCSCKDGYYVSNNDALACSICHLSCLTCTGPSSNQCILCKDSQATLINSICTCNSGYFVTQSWACSQCHLNCKTCTGASESSCVTCLADNSYFSLLTSTCQCLEGYFMQSQNPLTCASCHTTCATCSNSFISSCISCKSANSALINGQCNCLEGFYLNDLGNCQTCDPSCFTCQGPSKYDCLSCSDNKANLVNGVCQCIDSFFYNSTSAACESCGNLCYKCDEEGKCLECIDESLVIESGICECAKGSSFDYDLQICLKCSENCERCNVSDFKCILCEDHETQPIDGVCPCKSNQYLDDLGKCLSCSLYCNNCVNETYCESCVMGYFLTENKTCIECNPDCLNCSSPSPDQCLSCKDTSITLSSAPSACTCKSDQYTKSKDPLICSNCQTNCLTCNSSHCFKCEKGFKLQDSTCEYKYFYLNIKVLSNQSVSLQFSENLEKSLQTHKLQVNNGDYELSFDLINLSSSHYLVEFTSYNFNGATTIYLKFLYKVYSLNESILYKADYSFKVNKNTGIKFGFTEGIKSVLINSIVFSALASVIFNDNNPYIWLSLNTIQIICFSPLVNIKIPAYLDDFLIGLRPISIIKFDWITSKFFNCDTKSIPDKFYEHGFVCKNFLHNIVELTISFLAGIIFLVLIIILKLIPIVRLRKYFDSKIKSYRYDFFLRFWIQSYVEFLAPSVISINYVILI